MLWKLVVVAEDDFYYRAIFGIFLLGHLNLKKQLCAHAYIYINI